MLQQQLSKVGYMTAGSIRTAGPVKGRKQRPNGVISAVPLHTNVPLAVRDLMGEAADDLGISISLYLEQVTRAERAQRKAELEQEAVST